MDRRSLTLWTFIALAALVFGALPVCGDDWPQFRGPHRDGMSSETGLLAEWPEGGPLISRGHKITVCWELDSAAWKALLHRSLA